MNSHRSFDKILIANRGEIALRVMRSAHAMGYRTVAVYSEADRYAPHVTAADESVCIGPAPAAQSYLNVPAILEAAALTGAGAVHPGYGFLAENAAFAAACQSAGLTFIGPDADTIALMGDKARAKRRMAQAGLPGIPGYQGDEQSLPRLEAEALLLGFPLLIKARAGGGGRGMRRVDQANQFAALLDSARAEALKAFGDETVMLERLVVKARHIEIQIVGDRYGQVIHLGERDCSVQRRHQKLIEESPSPALDAALRARMGEACVSAARAIGYVGVGTFEFLLDEQHRFHFMEMNTRLQVEHPVTEALHGVDLVAWQIRIAAGEGLGDLGADTRPVPGHAIEARLCAEDATQGFLPQSGEILRWRAPEGLRVEHALRAGDSVSPHYDSMIAKLIAVGASRDEARRTLIRALEQTVLLGVRSNAAFLAQCLRHESFQGGAVRTDFVDLHREALTELPAPKRAALLALAGWVLTLGRAGQGLLRPASSLSMPWPLERRLSIEGRQSVLRMERLPTGALRMRVDQQSLILQALAVEDGCARCVLDGVTLGLEAVPQGDGVWLHALGGNWWIADDSLKPERAHAVLAADGRVRAALSARVMAVKVAVGEAVQAGQTLVVLEAMKMEHGHRAPISGRVMALHCAPGDTCTAGALLIELSPASEAG